MQRWISEATGLPSLSIDDPAADPSAHDFLVLGSSIVFYRATIRSWVEQKSAALATKPIILFTVSGAPAGSKLTDGWRRAFRPSSCLRRIRWRCEIG